MQKQAVELSVESQSRSAPGARAWPIIGDPAALLGARNLLEYVENNWHRYGDVSRIHLPGASMLVVAHPEALKHVLRTRRENYIKGSAYDAPRRLIGNSVLTLEGDAWKERRTLAQPAFHRRSLEKLTEIMLDSGARAFDALAARARGAALEIDVNREMTQLTLDVVTNALFGQALTEGSIPVATLGNALEVMSEGANGLPLPAWVPTPNNIRFNRTLAVLDELVYRVIRLARQQQREDGSLLSMLLGTRDERGAPLSDKTIRDEVLTLFIAGHETTALTLTWMFVLLDNQPQVLARMQREVRDVLGHREPTFGDVAKLKYVRQVIDETLRLRPPVPYLPRNALADDVIDGYQVRAGDMVLMFFWGAHRHPDYWPQAESFDPDRFDPNREHKRDSWCYLPFSAGPRTCIGNMFSLIETQLLVAQLLHRFDVNILPCSHIKPVAIATVRPSSAVRVVLTPQAL